MERSIQTLDMNDCENCSSLHSRRSSNTRARDRAMRHGRVCARASHTARSHSPSLEHLLHRLELIRQFSSTGNLSHTDGLLPVLCFSNKQHQHKIVTTALNNSTGRIKKSGLLVTSAKGGKSLPRPQDAGTAIHRRNARGNKEREH